MSSRPLPLSSSVLSSLLVICPPVSLLTSINVLYAKKMITNTNGMYLKEDRLFFLRKSKYRDINKIIMTHISADRLNEYNVAIDIIPNSMYLKNFDLIYGRYGIKRMM